MQTTTPKAHQGRPGSRAVSARVLIDGHGPMVESLQTALVSARHVVQSGRLAVDRIEFALRSGEATVLPDLVILVAEAAVLPTRSGPWQRCGVPLLPVVHDSGRVSVGPVVVPGAPCLRCLDLHRIDRDPSWAGTLACWSTRAPQAILEPEIPLLGAAMTLLLLRNLLHERRHLRGVSLEVAPPEPQIIARHWTIHPRCGCAATQETMDT